MLPYNGFQQRDLKATKIKLGNLLENKKVIGTSFVAACDISDGNKFQIAVNAAATIKNSSSSLAIFLEIDSSVTDNIGYLLAQKIYASTQGLDHCVDTTIREKTFVA